MSAGNPRGRTFDAAYALFQLPYQQVDGQPDQGQAEHADHHQQLRRIGIELIQRPQRHDPAGARHRRINLNGFATAHQRHHRVALVQSAALVVIEAGAVAGQQLQLVTKAAGGLELGQTLGLFGLGIADQFVDQQVDGGARQLFAELLHLAGQHQMVLGADQGINRHTARPQRFDQHLPTQQSGFQAALQADVFQRAHPQRDAQQAPPEVSRLPPLDGRHAAHVVRHQAKGAGGERLAVMISAHLVEQVQASGPEQPDQHQHGEHPAVDAQEDRIHCSASAASETNR